MRLALSLLLCFAVQDGYRDALHRKGTSGPGAIQEGFVAELAARLEKEFGKKRAARLLGKLKKKSLSVNDVRKLLNGNATTSQVQKWFGAHLRDVPGIEAAIEGSIGWKDRSGFFGILLHVMVRDFGLDPTADFCVRAAGAKDEITAEEFGKLRTGDVSKSTIRKVFGFKAEDDCRFMQEILNAVNGSPLVKHPMLQSMGMGRDGKFDNEKFPEPQEGMPGHGMKGGKAGGLSCDLSLPPCPFLPGTYEELLKAVEAELKKPDERGKEDK